MLVIILRTDLLMASFDHIAIHHFGILKIINPVYRFCMSSRHLIHTFGLALNPMYTMTLFTYTIVYKYSFYFTAALIKLNKMYWCE